VQPRERKENKNRKSDNTKKKNVETTWAKDIQKSGTTKGSRRKKEKPADEETAQKQIRARTSDIYNNNQRVRR